MKRFKNKKIKALTSFLLFVSSFCFFPQSYSSLSNKPFSKINSKQKGSLSSQKNSEGKTESLGLAVSRLWGEAAIFTNGFPTLYYLKENFDIIASAVTQPAVSSSKISQPKKLFSESEKEKRALLQKLSVKNRKSSFFVIKQKDSFLILYSKGSYIDFKGKKVLFEDWSFYHNKTTFHFLIHAGDLLNKREVEAIGILFKDIVLSNKKFSDQDKKHLLNVFEEVNGEVKKNES